MNFYMNRRRFIQTTSTGLAALAMPHVVRASTQSSELRVLVAKTWSTSMG
ncbi:secreted protein [Sinorhizobium americanum]|uniref:Secreted protein n=1 Tax=Sinorhizobium americanum TaxID=194963 RepID=A0A4R2AVI1_9HYPH|nr:secreted protein [Sinorhizobium americanum]